ncbi:MAG: DUF3850 domain-containing protein [Clostridia bacterium]|nr:DUF3850 domain-containing protein [Clostridia bacterium]
MAHHLKTMPEYFQATIDGRKNFEVREDDRGFKVGDNVILEEYEGFVDIPECPDFGKTCPPVEYDPSTEQEDYRIPEDCKRRQCQGYRKELYTGRRCLVKIKEIFKLDAIGLNRYVAFTHDILNIIDKKEKQ